MNKKAKKPINKSNKFVVEVKPGRVLLACRNRECEDVPHGTDLGFFSLSSVARVRAGTLPPPASFNVKFPCGCSGSVMFTCSSLGKFTCS